jgi:hypothetical protein
LKNWTWDYGGTVVEFKWTPSSRAPKKFGTKELQPNARLWWLDFIGYIWTEKGQSY